MTITNEAKAVFLEAIERTGKPIIHVGLFTRPCGGKGFDLRLIDEEESSRISEVNGLKVDISEEDEMVLSELIFEECEGKLRVVLPKPSCHNEGGCGGDCDDCKGCDDCDGCGEA